jgi:hypothetical protein
MRVIGHLFGRSAALQGLSLTVGLTVLTTGAGAQFAPPPPRESQVQEVEYVAPPEPPQRPTQQQQNPREGVRRTQGAPALPEIPWEGIVVRDESGAPQIWKHQSVHLLVLKHNPLVGEETLEAIREPVLEWVQTVDQIALDNLDLALQVDEGFLESLDFSQQADIMTANEIRNALFPRPTFLTNHLANEGLLTKAQADFNKHMVTEYTHAITFWIRDQVEAEYRARAAEEGRELTEAEETQMRKDFLTQGAAFTFGIMCQDAVWSARRQLLAAADHLDEILPTLELEGDLADKAKATAEALKKTDAKEERYQLMRQLAEAMISVDFYYVEEMILAARDLAEDDAMPELEGIAEKPNGEEPREDLKDWRPGDRID